MNRDSHDRIRSSFRLLESRATELTGRFYDKLFASHPTVRPLFPAEMEEQKTKLAQSLATVVANIDDLTAVRPALEALGARHAGYGALPAHYAVVRDTLLEVMAEMAGELWNDTLRDDWTGAINAVADAMLDGATSS